MEPETGMTVGVEEEFHILHPGTGRLAPGAKQIMKLVPPGVGPATTHKELQHAMIEAASPVCRDLTELRTSLVAARRALVGAADELGLWIAAAGSLPTCGNTHAPVFPDARYRHIFDDYRQIAAEQQVCASQVHVGVPDADLAIRLTARLRGWLPPLLAISAGSPYFRYDDTGYASYRAVLISRWPTSGPIPLFADLADYRRRIGRLIRAGVIDDYGMIYYDVRPSVRYPTLEIRIADACPLVDDVILLSALARALVLTAAREEADGVPPIGVRDELLRGATWRAARSGLRGPLIDAVSGDSISAAGLVRRLVRHVSDALDTTGDADLVAAGLEAVFRRGNSAERQRRALTYGGGMAGVAASVVDETRRCLAQ